MQEEDSPGTPPRVFLNSEEYTLSSLSSYKLSISVIGNRQIAISNSDCVDPFFGKILKILHKDSANYYIKIANQIVPLKNIKEIKIANIGCKYAIIIYIINDKKIFFGIDAPDKDYFYKDDKIISNYIKKYNIIEYGSIASMQTIFIKDYFANSLGKRKRH